MNTFPNQTFTVLIYELKMGDFKPAQNINVSKHATNYVGGVQLRLYFTLYIVGLTGFFIEANDFGH